MKKLKNFTLLALAIVAMAAVLISSTVNSKATEIKKSETLMPQDSTINWATMSFEEKKNYMKNVVMPTMRAEFVAFDSVRFEAMNCRTCHGSGVKAGDFKMPNSRIAKLTMNFEEMAHDNPNYMQFMGKVVKPKMAALLGLKPYSHDNPTGFGCQSCHMFEE
jgi:hypothetical protein